jgi:Ca2+-binding EF-hand superfamily protein
LQGDLNGDGTVDIADGVFILTIMAGEETEEGLRQGDLNKDGKVDIADFVSILIIMAGM